MADPNNQMPEIPSFKSTQQDKDKKASGPTLPQGGLPRGGSALRLRGPGGAASTIMERLKQLRKKDLIFIGAGLSVLLTAPLAEHYMMGPSGQSNVLQKGFATNGSPFSEANPYEPSEGLAPGGAPGQSSDIITPLNARDPMNLIMGAGAAQQPPTTAAGAGGGGNPEDYKNAIAAAARGGAVSAAAAAPGLPMAHGSLSGALRGLSALSGATSGGGTTSALPPISQNGVPNRGGGGSHFVDIAAAPGYKGVAPHSLGPGSSIEALKSAANAAGNEFPRKGSAIDSLQRAAATAIPGGGNGLGGASGPGGGQGGGNASGSNFKENKQIGESLAYLRAKMLQEKEIELMYKKKSWLEFERAQEIQKELIKLIIDNLIGEALLKPIGSKTGDWLKNTLFGTSDSVLCIPNVDLNDGYNTLKAHADTRVFPQSAWDQVAGTGAVKPDDSIGDSNSSNIKQWVEWQKGGKVACYSRSGNLLNPMKGNQYGDGSSLAGPNAPNAGSTAPGGVQALTPLWSQQQLTDYQAAITKARTSCGTDSICTGKIDQIQHAFDATKTVANNIKEIRHQLEGIAYYEWKNHIYATGGFMGAVSDLQGVGNEYVGADNPPITGILAPPDKGYGPQLQKQLHDASVADAATPPKLDDKAAAIGKAQNSIAAIKGLVAGNTAGQNSVDGYLVAAAQSYVTAKDGIGSTANPMNAAKSLIDQSWTAINSNKPAMETLKGEPAGEGKWKAPAEQIYAEFQRLDEHLRLFGDSGYVKGLYVSLKAGLDKTTPMITTGAPSVVDTINSLSGARTNGAGIRGLENFAQPTMSLDHTQLQAASDAAKSMVDKGLDQVGQDSSAKDLAMIKKNSDQLAALGDVDRAIQTDLTDMSSKLGSGGAAASAPAPTPTPAQPAAPTPTP